eukprot:CFRG6588T1
MPIPHVPTANLVHTSNNDLNISLHHEMDDDHTHESTAKKLFNVSKDAKYKTADISMSIPHVPTANIVHTSNNDLYVSLHHEMDDDHTHGSISKKLFDASKESNYETADISIPTPHVPTANIVHTSNHHGINAVSLTISEQHGMPSNNVKVANAHIAQVEYQKNVDEGKQHKHETPGKINRVSQDSDNVFSKDSSASSSENSSLVNSTELLSYAESTVVSEKTTTIHTDAEKKPMIPTYRTPSSAGVTDWERHDAELNGYNFISEEVTSEIHVHTGHHGETIQIAKNVGIAGEPELLVDAVSGVCSVEATLSEKVENAENHQGDTNNDLHVESELADDGQCMFKSHDEIGINTVCNEESDDDLEDIVPSSRTYDYCNVSSNKHRSCRSDMSHESMKRFISGLNKMFVDRENEWSGMENIIEYASGVGTVCDHMVENTGSDAIEQFGLTSEGGKNVDYSEQPRTRLESSDAEDELPAYVEPMAIDVLGARVRRIENRSYYLETIVSRSSVRCQELNGMQAHIATLERSLRANQIVLHHVSSKLKQMERLGITDYSHRKEEISFSEKIVLGTLVGVSLLFFYHGRRR